METVEDRTYNDHRIATALHDVGSNRIVIFAHGFRGTSVGPNRFFVRAARDLAQRGVSSLRFDQYGSGNSDGDFLDSSFDGWVRMIETIASDYLDQGFEVALFGQSMGASAVIVAASQLPQLSAIVAWVPDASIDAYDGPEIAEEKGQRVSASFWREAHAARIPERLSSIKAPALIVQCTGDEYVDAQNRAALERAVAPDHSIATYDGLSHSMWTYEQAEEIIERSVRFVVDSFGSRS